MRIRQIVLVALATISLPWEASAQINNIRRLINVLRDTKQMYQREIPKFENQARIREQGPYYLRRTGILFSIVEEFMADKGARDFAESAFVFSPGTPLTQSEANEIGQRFDELCDVQCAFFGKLIAVPTIMGLNTLYKIAPYNDIVEALRKVNNAQFLVYGRLAEGIGRGLRDTDNRKLPYTNLNGGQANFTDCIAGAILTWEGVTFGKLPQY
ncbi:hypothetical protein TWF281_009524 [Arthrobotrys megalospora]